MPARPYLLAEAHWPDVRDTPYEVAILPWGATEAHNTHLPYGTDVIEAEHVAAEAARKAWDAGARPIVLPTVPFGVNTGQLDLRLDLNMMPSTQAAILRDLADVLARNGPHKLVVLNTHGGNHFRQMLRELGPAFPTLFFCTVDWWKIGDAAACFDEPGDHAGELETSVMQHLTPHLVRPLEQAGPGTARRFKIPALRQDWAWAERQWSQVTTDTGVGNPARSTAQKGARFFDATTSEFARFLVDLAAADLDDLYEDAP